MKKLWPLLLFLLLSCAPVHGYVKEKHYEPAYTSWMMVPAGKTVTLMPLFHPAMYWVEVEPRGACFLAQEQWEKIQIEDEVDC